MLFGLLDEETDPEAIVNFPLLSCISRGIKYLKLGQEYIFIRRIFKNIDLNLLYLYMCE